MGIVQKIRLMREFNQARRAARRENPDMSEEECCAIALDALKAKYGPSADWPTILQMILEILMQILPFFLMSEEDE